MVYFGSTFAAMEIIYNTTITKLPEKRILEELG